MNTLKKQENLRQNKIKRNKEPVDPTLGEVINERIKAQIGTYMRKNNITTTGDLER
ncbi:10919_t:CDS:1, partial [Cetraspora pellucida]